MAVAYKGEMFGMAEKQMKVADPVVISTALPRFLSPGDNAKVPVTITNTTEKSSKAKVSIKVDGPLNIQGESTITVDLPPNAEKQVMFDVEAIQDIGNAKVTVLVDAFKEVFSETVNIPESG